MRKLPILAPLVATVLLATAAGAQTPPTSTTTRVLQATVMVDGQPIDAAVVFKRTGPPQNEAAALIDVLRTVAVVAAVAVQLDRLGVQTAGMRCYRKDTGEKVPCFPQQPVMTAGTAHIKDDKK